MKRTQTQKEVAAAESELLLVLVERLRNDLTKWDELVRMAGSSTMLGTAWAGGKYNDAEELAAAAVAERYELIDAMDTEFNASVRRIAEYVQAPYTKLLSFFTKYYVLNTEPAYCSYIPYKALEAWTRQE